MLQDYKIDFLYITEDQLGCGFVWSWTQDIILTVAHMFQWVRQKGDTKNQNVGQNAFYSISFTL
jgi:hypothetical protein